MSSLTLGILGWRFDRLFAKPASIRPRPTPQAVPAWEDTMPSVSFPALEPAAPPCAGAAASHARQQAALDLSLADSV